MSERQKKPTLHLFAGSIGVSGSIDGFGKIARFKFPSAITIDPEGSFYVVGKVNDIDPLR